jgi:hypothetical protein
MKCAWLLLAAIGLAGCATAPPTTTSADTIVTDQAKMSQIERAARSSGLTVIWINAPRKVAPAGS